MRSEKGEEGQMARTAALQACKACGESVSPKAKFCPNCGHPPPSTAVRNFLLSLLLPFLLLLYFNEISNIYTAIRMIKVHMEEVYPPQDSMTIGTAEALDRLSFPFNLFP